MEEKRKRGRPRKYPIKDDTISKIPKRKWGDHTGIKQKVKWRQSPYNDKFLKPGGSTFKEGTYKLKNIKKYVNKEKPYYTNTWDKIWIKFCDESKTIEKWGIELYEIEWNNPINKEIEKHKIKYWAQIKSKEWVDEYLIEIIPSYKLKKPLPPRNSTCEMGWERYNIEMKEYIEWFEKIKMIKKFAILNEKIFMIVDENFKFGRGLKYKTKK